MPRRKHDDESNENVDRELALLCPPRRESDRAAAPSGPSLTTTSACWARRTCSSPLAKPRKQSTATEADQRGSQSTSAALDTEHTLRAAARSTGALFHLKPSLRGAMSRRRHRSRNRNLRRSSRTATPASSTTGRGNSRARARAPTAASIPDMLELWKRASALALVGPRPPAAPGIGTEQQQEQADEQEQEHGRLVLALELLERALATPGASADADVLAKRASLLVALGGTERTRPGSFEAQRERWHSTLRMGACVDADADASRVPGESLFERAVAAYEQFGAVLRTQNQHQQQPQVGMSTGSGAGAGLGTGAGAV